MADPNAAGDFEAAAARVREIVDGASTDLVPLTAASPEGVRTQYGTQLADAVRAASALRAAAATREAELRQQLYDQLALVHEIMGPLNEQMKRLEEGMWTIHLYLGRDEQIQQLADGAPAPAGTPITLRQLVLAMDEECLVAAESGGIDASRVADFGAWLTADPRHLDQVLPDPKGVVILVPSRQRRDYGNAWTNSAMNEANKISYWLIRNGERVYLMTTDIEVRDRMLPARSEFVEFFSQEEHWGANRGDRRPLIPGSDAWIKAEQKADARRRHYMRIMLVLQGLADRTTVFQPLPAPVNFLSLSAQDNGQVRIINEVDNVLTTGRPSFRAWQADLNRELVPGMRIIGAFDSTSWSDVSGYERNQWKHERLRPETASSPQSSVIHIINGRAPQGGLTFLYHRTDTIFDTTGYRYEERAPKVRASCTIYPDRDDFVLPYDLVTIDDLQTYLHARTERHNYLAMIPVIRAAIAAKRAEAAAEEPFRKLLAGRLAAANNLDVADVEAGMGELVDWWKLTNRCCRPLVADPVDEARAITAIEKEWNARRATAERGGLAPHFELAAIEGIRSERPEAICVARRRGGDYVAYEPADGNNIWVHEHRYRISRHGLKHVETREWAMVAGRTAAALTVLWSTDRWQKWNHRASRSEHLTGPEQADLTQRMIEMVGRDGTPIAVTYREAERQWDTYGARTFYAYAWSTTPGCKPTSAGDPIDLMILSVGVWRRDQTGRPDFSDSGRSRGRRWGNHRSEDGTRPTPWETTPGLRHDQLVWSDPEQLARVETVWIDIETRHEASRATARQVGGIRESLRLRWTAAEEKRQYERFMQDYAGADDLWEGHRKTLKIDYREPWQFESAVSELVMSDVDLAGLTVAQAMALTEQGRKVKLPADLADMPLIVVDSPTED